jgi:hypothetical protein
MAAEQGITHPPVAAAPETTAVYAEGLRAGLAGAATIAGWFFLLDAIRGRPLYTPTVLGIALFRHGAGLGNTGTIAPNFDMVMSFTWVHLLVFLLIGIAASRLIGVVERNPSLGFGVVILAVFFEFGFFLACMVFAYPVLHVLTWSEVLVGNLLAATAMGAVFWRRHPRLVISP